jgi:hypothetical protein
MYTISKLSSKIRFYAHVLDHSTYMHTILNYMALRVQIYKNGSLEM